MPGRRVRPRSRAWASIQPARAPALGALNSRTVPPAALIASASRLGVGPLAPEALESTIASALPGATRVSVARNASRSSPFTTSDPAFRTTASVPPPNMTEVATRSLRSRTRPPAWLRLPRRIQRSSGAPLSVARAASKASSAREADSSSSPQKKASGEVVMPGRCRPGWRARFGVTPRSTRGDGPHRAALRPPDRRRPRAGRPAS